MNSNSYFITAYSIPFNIYSYYIVITITVYQTSPKCFVGFKTHSFVSFGLLEFWLILF